MCGRGVLPTRAGQFVEDCGQGLVEYALILALASLGVVLAVLILQDSLGTTFQGASARIDAASTATSPPRGAAGGAGVDQSGADEHGHGRGGGYSGNANPQGK
jgi:Flp pilus assembly pilin Flp